MGSSNKTLNNDDMKHTQKLKDLLEKLENADPPETRIFVDGLWYECNPKTGTAEVYLHNQQCAGNILIPAIIYHGGRKWKVVEISDMAFQSCENLQSVLISKGITRIGDHAFAKCHNLKKISLPDSLHSIESYSFYDCTSLARIDIPKNVSYIHPTAFSVCPELHIYVDKENPVYDSRENCQAIIETATNTLYAGNKFTKIPSSVTNIGKYAYNGCLGIKEMIIPEGIESIGFMAFGNGSSTTLSSICSIVIPESVVKIESAFSFNKNLKSVIWNAINCRETIFDMGEHSCAPFVDTGVTSFVLGPKVEHIPSLLFKDMNKLKSLIIPPSVKTIADNAFHCCRKLTHVQVPQHLYTRAKEMFGTQTGIHVYSKKEEEVLFPKSE